MSQPNTTPLPVQVAIADEGNVVSRWTAQPGGGAIRTGAVWGPAVDDPKAWFGVRHDIGDDEPRRFPTREEAVKWLEGVVTS